MGYAKHVGRVGALAVALGIGAAVATTPGVAWADGTEDTHVSDGGGTNPESPDTTSPTERQDPGEAIRKSIERTADNLRKVVTGVVQSSGGAITSTHRTGSGSPGGNLIPEILKGKDPQPPKDEPQLTLVQEANNDGPGSFTPPRWRAPLSQINVKPAQKPVSKVLDDVKETVQQTITEVTGNQPGTGSTNVGQKAVSTFDASSTQDQQAVRTPFVAPIKLIT